MRSHQETPPKGKIVRYLLANKPRDLPESNRDLRGCNPSPCLLTKVSCG